MENNFLELNKLIHEEADQLLYNKGLLKILKKYGTPQVTGSYDLDLMTWRDLDIYLEITDMSPAVFFQLGRDLVELFDPVKMSFRNEKSGRNKELPLGLYWGIYLGNERSGAWKIDIWAVETIELKRLLSFTDQIREKLTNENRLKILEIKSRCWKDPGYRRSYNSADIYSAVTDYGISSLSEFETWLGKRSE